MKIFTVLLLSFLFACSILNSQSNESLGSIKGSIFDPNSQPVEYATISLFNEENELITGTISDEKGVFNLEKLALGSYEISIDFLGYTTFTKKDILLTSDSPKLRLGTISLSLNEQQMDVVEVVGEKSSYNLQLDKKVFHVGKDVLSQGGSAIDILDQVPLVSVDPTGTVTLRGSSQVQILINGRRSGLTLNNAVDQIDGDNIERIEVVTNPSSQYDANGSAGIINIILKKNKDSGLKGQVRLTAGTPANHSIVPSLTYKTNNINLFTNLRWRYSDYNGIYSTTQTTNQDAQVISLTNNEIEDRHDDGASGYFGGDYFINDFNSITLAYYRNQTKDTDFTTLNYLLNSSSIIREGNSLENRNYNQIEANYTRTFLDKKTRWTVDFQYDFWNSEKDWQLSTFGDELPNLVASSLRTNNISKSKDYALRTDFEKPISQNAKMELGAKVENRIVNNDYLAENEEGGQWSVFEGINNEFEYSEIISAAYMQLEKSIKKFEFQVGVRAEYTQIEIGDASELFSDEKDYFNLFPTAFVSYQINDGNTIQGSYSRRINRPSLWSIYPFSEITDFNRQRIGNPDLDPSFTNGFEISYLNVNDLFTINPTLFYKRTSNDFSTYLFQSESGTFFLQPINIERNNEAGIEMSVRYRPFKTLSINTELNYYVFDEKGFYNSTQLNARGSSWGVRTNINLRLPLDARLQIRYDYRGPRKGAQIEYFGSSDFTVGVNKNFLDDKINISLRGSNIFDSRIQKSKSINQEYSIEQSNRRTGARYSISVLYKFNQTSKDRMRNANRGNR